MNDTLTTLFCLVDDFCQIFYPAWNQHLLEQQLKKRNKECTLKPSEIIVIFLFFHHMQFRNFKAYYLFVQTYLKPYFPKLVSYNRFIELIPSILVPLCVLMQTLTGEKTGIYFIDSTPLKVCHIRREKQHKVFKGFAKKAKSSTGWVFGFKLHLVMNDKGEIMAFTLTAANINDQKPTLKLVKHLKGKLIGDKGYLSQKLFDTLWNQGLQLITKIKKNMKNKLMLLTDKFLLRKRAVIECVNDQLKNVSQIEHTRHRSVFNFMANLLAALITYSLQPKKPSIYREDFGEKSLSLQAF